MASELVVLSRGDCKVQVPFETWVSLLNFLGKVGWKPSVPLYWFLSPDMEVSEEDALHLAATGHIIQEETLKDPMSAVGVISFDMGKFAEIVVFCEEGAFTICR